MSTANSGISVDPKEKFWGIVLPVILLAVLLLVAAAAAVIGGTIASIKKVNDSAASAAGAMSFEVAWAQDGWWVALICGIVAAVLVAGFFLYQALKGYVPQA